MFLSVYRQFLEILADCVSGYLDYFQQPEIIIAGITIDSEIKLRKIVRI